jgi:hypothetical protein
MGKFYLFFPGKSKVAKMAPFLQNSGVSGHSKTW